MSALIEDLEGIEHKVPVSLLSNTITDFYLRLPSLEFWEISGLELGLLTKDEDGKVVKAKGVDFVVLGPVELVAPEYDADDEIITPGVYDNRTHINVRLSTPITLRGQWKKLSILWANTGTKTTPNNIELGFELNQIELVDPETIARPRSTWAGS